jgi:hypothetical protein
MRIKSALAAAAVAAGLALVGTAASAAPISAPLSSLKADAQATSPVDQVSYRCWWRHGRRHCAHTYAYAPPVVYGFYAGPRHGHHRSYRRW